MLMAMLLSAAISDAPARPSLHDFTSEVDRILLSGRAMPRALLLDLDRLDRASDRFLAVIYLRRSGLLTGAEMPLERLLMGVAAPAAPPAPAHPISDTDNAD
ncbi:hypothetical protein SAMN05421538_103171 [Paracoccus isoporae]|uniref:Uncharacterized protein n=1 Tax=Paracoccus isoporae TaxID=591205 RepID=A0A1G6Z8D2_9RHOB|nr:hypothetical protein [Paracoccus isoporae]SDD98145.1 hypothetical protein SAMN05421538_103171 [Paracoccus isoporae]